jgi:hypothetical protein
MYSGTNASYRYGRTIRRHYPYVVTRQLIWTARRWWRLSSFLICDMRVLPPKQASLGSTELLSQIDTGRTEAPASPRASGSPFRRRSRARPGPRPPARPSCEQTPASHDAAYGADRSPLSRPRRAQRSGPLRHVPPTRRWPRARARSCRCLLPPRAAPRATSRWWPALPRRAATRWRDRPAPAPGAEVSAGGMAPPGSA